MTETVKLISPIDGSIYAERPIATDQAGRGARSTRARGAGRVGADVDRRARRIMLAMLDALLAMTDEIVPELAWQMGRPVRYGGEMGGVEERTRYMVEIAETGAGAGAGSNPKDGFRRY